MAIISSNGVSTTVGFYESKGLTGNPKTVKNRRDIIMKKFAVAFAAIFVLAIACGGAATPDQVVKKMIDAFEAKDGTAILECMSAEAVAELDAQVDEMKAAPEESAAFMAMIGIEVTADEITNMTSGEFLTKMLSSEMLADELPDMSTVEIGEVVIEGETATVAVTLDGDTDNIDLVLEDGQWKIAEMMGM